jgi:hypothetical protein
LHCKPVSVSALGQGNGIKLRVAFYKRRNRAGPLY